MHSAIIFQFFPYFLNAAKKSLCSFIDHLPAFSSISKPFFIIKDTMIHILIYIFYYNYTLYMENIHHLIQEIIQFLSENEYILTSHITEAYTKDYFSNIPND